MSRGAQVNPAMAVPSTEMEALHLPEDTKDEHPLASSSASRGKSPETDAQETPDHLPQESDDDRDAALRSELQNVRHINQVVSGVVDSLQGAKENMETVSRTVRSASTLLDTWTRILSQTEHNQRLILNPSWQGATKDITEIENEALQRQQEVERKALEEQQRREALAKKHEEEERKRAQSTSSTSRGARGATRTRSRVSYSAPGTHSTVRPSTRGSTAMSTSSSSSGIRRATGSGTRSSGTTRNRGGTRGP